MLMIGIIIDDRSGGYIHLTPPWNNWSLHFIYTGNINGDETHNIITSQ